MDTSICGLCGTALASGAKFCSQCGLAVDPTGRPAAPSHPRWYFNIWFVLFMLFFVLGPLGLPLVWKNPKFSRTVKLVLTLLMVVYTLFLVQLTIQAFRTVSEHFNDLNSVL